MSLILQRYARFGNCLRCHLTFTRQKEVRRYLSCSRLLQNQPKKEITDFECEENVITAIVVLGVAGMAGTVLFAFGKELFVGDSPQEFYRYGSDKCMNHEKVQDLLGKPIKLTSPDWVRVGRGSHIRKEVEHTYYIDKSGKKGLRIQIGLIGVQRHAVAELDARENDNGKLQTRWIIVTTSTVTTTDINRNDINRKSVIVEDNRWSFKRTSRILNQLISLN